MSLPHEFRLEALEDEQPHLDRLPDDDVHKEDGEEEGAQLAAARAAARHRGHDLAPPHLDAEEADAKGLEEGDVEEREVAVDALEDEELVGEAADVDGLDAVVLPRGEGERDLPPREVERRDDRRLADGDEGGGDVGAADHEGDALHVCGEELHQEDRCHARDRHEEQHERGGELAPALDAPREPEVRLRLDGGERGADTARFHLAEVARAERDPQPLTRVEAALWPALEGGVDRWRRRGLPVGAPLMPKDRLPALPRLAKASGPEDDQQHERDGQPRACDARVARRARFRRSLRAARHRGRRCGRTRSCTTRRHWM